MGSGAGVNTVRRFPLSGGSDIFGIRNGVGVGEGPSSPNPIPSPSGSNRYQHRNSGPCPAPMPPSLARDRDTTNRFKKILIETRTPNPFPSSRHPKSRSHAAGAAQHKFSQTFCHSQRGNLLEVEQGMGGGGEGSLSTTSCNPLPCNPDQHDPLLLCNATPHP